MKYILLFAFSAVLSASCKKERACVCTNPGGEEIVFTSKTSKSNAESQCKEYYQEHYANIPWNETSCEIK